jgi:hypothetical protein
MAGALVGKAFVGLNKRLVKLEGGRKIRFRKGCGRLMLGRCTCPCVPSQSGTMDLSPSPAYFITFLR